MFNIGFCMMITLCCHVLYGMDAERTVPETPFIDKNILRVTVEERGFGFSIRELIDNGWMPAVIQGRLDASGMFLEDLTGLEDVPGIQRVQCIDFSGNQLQAFSIVSAQHLDNKKVILDVGVDDVAVENIFRYAPRVLIQWRLS